MKARTTARWLRGDARIKTISAGRAFFAPDMLLYCERFRLVAPVNQD
jgi:hypothetical protein